MHCMREYSIRVDRFLFSLQFKNLHKLISSLGRDRKIHPEDIEKDQVQTIPKIGKKTHCKSKGRVQKGDST
jgi:hypothetical protein